MTRTGADSLVVLISESLKKEEDLSLFIQKVRAFLRDHPNTKGLALQLVAPDINQVPDSLPQGPYEPP